MKTRLCNTCHEEKRLSEYYRSQQGKDGRGNVCKDCSRARSLAHYHANKEAFAERLRNQRAQPGHYRAETLYTRYKLRPEEYDALLLQQGGACAICGATKTDLRRRLLCVDHCHKTGKVRGLLCLNCNTALGKFQDSPDLLLKAHAYLTKTVEAAPYQAPSHSRRK